MKCKNCGAEIRSSDSFCPACGAKAIAEEKETVTCNGCGKQFDKNYEICPFCGSEREEKSEFPRFSTIGPNAVGGVGGIAGQNANESFGKKQEKNEKSEPSLRETLYAALCKVPVIGNLMGASSLFALAYPIYLLLSHIDATSGLVEFIDAFDKALLVLFYIGTVMCFAKRENLSLMLSFGGMALHTVLKFKYLDGIDAIALVGFYATIAYLAAKEYFRIGVPISEYNRKSFDDLRGNNVSFGDGILLVGEIFCFAIAEVFAWSARWMQFAKGTEIDYFTNLLDRNNIDVFTLNYLETIGNYLNKRCKANVWSGLYDFGAILFMVAIVITVVYAVLCFSKNPYRRPKGTFATICMVIGSLCLELYRLNVNYEIEELSSISNVSLSTTGISFVVILLAIAGCACGHIYFGRQRRGVYHYAFSD